MRILERFNIFKLMIIIRKVEKIQAKIDYLKEHSGNSKEIMNLCLKALNLLLKGMKYLPDKDKLQMNIYFIERLNGLINKFEEKELT